MTMQDWIHDVQELLNEMQAMDFGYPLGSNNLPPAQPPAVVRGVLNQLGLENHQALMDFYCHCDGICWPDVHVGYFLKPVERLPDSEPSSVAGPMADKVLTVGSSGGGDLFALSMTTSSILMLPPGAIHSGVYEDTGTVRQMSPDLGSFLEDLLDDLSAFVEDTANHKYII